MSQTTFVIRALTLAVIVAPVGCWNSSDQNDAGPAEADDAGQVDAGDLNAGERCDDPAPPPTGACPPGCQFDEVNIETQSSLEAFAAASHPAPLDTVNIFSAPGQGDPITDASPLASAVFTARSLEFLGPSSLADLRFSGIDVTGLLTLGITGASRVEFPLVRSLEVITVGPSEDLTYIGFPSLRQVSFVSAREDPLLCEIDLGAVSVADLCDPDLRNGLLRGTCQTGLLDVISCCSVPF